MNDRFGLGAKRNYEVVGRAATGIYAILCSKFSGAEVLVPANICPAAVYPILYSENRPVFCDVEYWSGNMSLKTLVAGITQETKAVIVPHMYGNPVEDIVEIGEYCRAHGLILIEDCASAMGAEVNGATVGSFGDYAIYSTGHAKTIDIGGGGIVASDYDLGDVVSALSAVVSDDELAQTEELMFSKVYRRFLNTRKPLANFSGRQYFQRDFRAIFLRGVTKDLQQKVISGVRDLLQATVNARRRRQLELERVFDRLVPNGRRYRYAPGGVPWRFSFFVSERNRQALADTMLSCRLPVSDWYPAMVELFGDEKSYPTANVLGRSILNLPLTVSDHQFVAACDLIARFDR